MKAFYRKHRAIVLFLGILWCLALLMISPLIGKAAATPAAADYCTYNMAFAGVEAITCDLYGSGWFSLTANSSTPGYRLKWGVSPPAGSSYTPTSVVNVGSGVWFAVNPTNTPGVTSVFAAPTWTLQILAMPPANVPGAAINLVVYAQGPAGYVEKIIIPARAGPNPQTQQTSSPVVI